MGVWGTGLYSGDFALDLRAAIGAVVRLPFDVDKLVDILCESESETANDPRHEEYTTFWLVVADQFAKRCIVSDRVRRRALEIIDSGQDIEMLRELEASEGHLRARRKMLGELRVRIAECPAGKPRKIIAEPQPLLMTLGDVIVFPTCGGHCINPYFKSKEKDLVDNEAGYWTQDGWAAAVIVDCGRAFEFLAWYRPLTITEALPDKPSMDALSGSVAWRIQLPGTCSPRHFKKLEIERIGKLEVEATNVRKVFAPLSFDYRVGMYAAISDISISNGLKASPYLRPAPKPSDFVTPTLMGINHILKT